MRVLKKLSDEIGISVESLLKADTEWVVNMIEVIQGYEEFNELKSMEAKMMQRS